MLNALEPGTIVPIHRHGTTSETVVIIRGKVVQHFYDDEGNVTDSIYMQPGGPTYAMNVPVGQWHRIESLESGTVILEFKNGPYTPITGDDVMSI
jgi:cupin fold WbuC family metalloprotein